MSAAAPGGAHQMRTPVKSDQQGSMHQQKAPVLSNRKVAPDIFLMTVRSPDMVALGRPGQFLHLRVGGSGDPLLRRPLSIFSLDERRQEMGLLYRRVGPGTRILSGLQPGSELDLIGPLGRAFSLLPGIEKALLVAGGLGIAPLFCLAQNLAGKGVPVHFLLGARCRDELLFRRRLEALGVKMELSTDDGSEGFHGLVTGLLQRVLDRDRPSAGSCMLFVTGPQPMMRAVAVLARRHRLEAQFSLERHMACGVGACWGCVVRCRDGRGRPVYRRACTDGPVFGLAELDWGRPPG
jgi:dihydroorotate dehydrogenase electron transfer subunit